ncbi:hypothetical protein GYMLUDRAFT_245675 [Collybiopsis luxurians FD-317 M1]|uniref:Retrotransposon gag domain-containing protein n=1 Tax=Collybiopsis luxurians FD-317 M1 TaxID=944289 RepID=A0A0D0BTV4_9AGAR|nr:hypothetical protein GYMLUDRAFT_245675 [Collybiopsis luxurians FD-317 M1]
MSLKTQTKQEIFSPRAEHLQAGSSKVHIGGEIPLDAALQLERLAARDKYAVSTTCFANESHPVGQYPEQTVTEPNLGCSLWPNHLGFRTDSLTYHRRETPKTFHENNRLEGLGWNARGLVNSPNTTRPGIPFSSRYSDPGNSARVGEQQNQWETLGPGQVKQWNMAYAPPSGERNEFENEGFNFLHPSALKTHHPMPPLEKKEFTPLRNVKGRGKVVNPFARESSRQTSEPPRITEVPPQQPAVQQTVHVPPPVVVETIPQAAGFTPPVFTAAPRQYVHPTGRNFDSIPAIPHRTPRRVTNDYHSIVPMHQESVRVPAEQYWRLGTREYRLYVAELTYDYSNRASTYRGYGVAGPPGGPPYGGVTQTGGISDGNSERERGSRNGSFRGGSGGGGPGGPGSPGGPPNDPDNWGSNHDAYWHPANGWVAILEFNQQKDRLNKEAKLDVKKPDPFNSSDRWKWEPFLLQVCRTFMAKPTIYKNDSDKIGFAVSYLTGAAATHYDNLLKQEEAGIPIPALRTWIDFVKLAWIKQMDNELFATFIIRFQEYAFKMGYNDTALVAMLRGAVTRNLNMTVAAQTHPPQNYPQWVQRFQELDNSICATNAAHSYGGNSGFRTYNPMAPSNPQNSNPQQGSNSNNPQQAKQE